MKAKLLLLTAAGLTAGSATLGLTSCFEFKTSRRDQDLNNWSKRITHQFMLLLQSICPDGVLTDDDIDKIENDFPNNTQKWPIEAFNHIMPYALNELHEGRKHMENTHKNPIVEGVAKIPPKKMWRNSEHLNPSNFWIFDNVGNIFGQDISFVTGHHLDNDSSINLDTSYIDNLLDNFFQNFK